MDLITILKVLLKRKWILILLPIIAAVSAYMFMAGYERTYKSSAQLSTGFTISEEIGLTEERFNMFEVDVKFNNLIEIMSSYRVLSLLSYQCLIHDLDSTQGAFRFVGDKLKEDLELKNLNFQEVKKGVQLRHDSMKALDKHLDRDRIIDKLLDVYEYRVEDLKDAFFIQRIKNTDYIKIDAYSENPFLSAFLVNILIQEFLRFNSLSTSVRSTESISVFARLVNQKKKELDEIAEQLRFYKSSNRLLNFTVESESKINQISDFENKINEERKNIRSIHLQLDRISRKINEAGGRSPEGTNKEILAIRKKISEVNQRYVAKGSVDAQLFDSLNYYREEQRRLTLAASRKINNSRELDELNETKSELETQLLIADQNLEELENLLVKVRRNVGGYASQEAQIAALERELEMASEEYKNAQEKYSKVLDVTSSSGSSIRQILIGQPASEPEPSKRVIITGFSGLSTLILCLIAIIFMEYLDVSLKTPSNFGQQVPLNLIGSLNRVNLNKHPIGHMFKAPRESLDKNSNLFRESLRKIRFHIEQSKAQVYLVTSTKPGEGKSTLIRAISLALSYNESKILIIDSNFFNNTLTRVYKTSVSLEKMLDIPTKEVKISVSKTSDPNIYVIGCKGGNYSPHELFPVGWLKKLLSLMKTRYDYIFLEGAALNAFSDSRELSEDVESVITVFSAYSTVKQIDKESIDFIKNLGTKNLGAVLNMVEKGNMDS